MAQGSEQTHWKGKTRGGNFGYLFFIYMIRTAGISVAYFFAALVVPYFIPSAPKATSSTWVYARKILNYSRLRSIGLLFRNYYCLAQILIDKLAIRNGLKDKFRFCFDGYEEFLEVLNSDVGVVMIGAHVGSWEMGTPFFDHYGKKINIVMYDAEHRRIKEILEKNAITAEYKVIPVNEDQLTHVFRIAEAIGNKEYVCFQGDRYLNSEKVLSCSFMGHRTKFPAGPFLLASRMKTPVVFFFALRESRRTYRFHFTLLHQIPRKKGVPPEQAVLEQYVETLEQVLHRHPEQWFNYYRFWGNS